MRLFIAVNFSEKVKRRILVVQDRIKEQAKKGKFPPEENLHLTLVFLGETPEDRIPEITNAMKAAVSSGEKPDPSFTITFFYAGFFKRGRKELWWLGTDARKNPNDNEPLKKLQKRLTSELLARNIPVDPKPFTAHITLGREITDGPWPFKTESIVIPVNRISLMLSEHKPVSGKKNTLVYTELFGYNFA